MVREVDDGRAVGGRLVFDAADIPFGPPIGHRAVQIPGIALFAVGADPLESHADPILLLQGRTLPDKAVETHGTAMALDGNSVPQFVWHQFVPLAIDGKRGMVDPVPVAADDAAHEPLRALFKRCDVSVPHDDISQLAVPVRDLNADDPRAIIAHGHPCARTVRQGVKASFALRSKAPRNPTKPQRGGRHCMNIIRLPTTAATNANVSRSPYDFMIMIYSVSTPGFGLESTGLPSRKEGSPVFLLYKIIQNIRFRATVFNQSLQKSEYKKACLLFHNVFRHRPDASSGRTPAGASAGGKIFYRADVCIFGSEGLFLMKGPQVPAIRQRKRITQKISR